MTEHAFTLIPYPVPNLPEIQITGRISRERNVVTIQYALAGRKDPILFPKPVPNPGRKTELWLGTCFEFFLALPNQPQYWEFNFSPSGEWNAFRMDSYRRFGFRQEELIQSPQIQIDHAKDCFHLSAAVDLDPVLGEESQIQAGVTSVIQTLDRYETYWALLHPNPQPDFHLRESFTLALE